MHSFNDDVTAQLLDPQRLITEAEHWQRFWQLWEHLILRAREAALLHAASWRNFRVGAAVYAWDSKRHAQGDFGRRWRVFTGANLKPTEEGHNVCAEQLAIGAARNDGYERILGCAVVGEPQPDGATGILHRTLHPCSRCRGFLRDLPEVHADTIIITAHLEDDGVVEMHTVADLLTIYQMQKEAS